MASHTRLEVLSIIAREGVVPVFYDPDVVVTMQVATTLVAGGISTIEFTNRGDGALDVLGELIRDARRRLPELIVGAGSIVDMATAAHVIDLGANFVFGPSFSPEVAGACHLRNVPYVPGCGTMTEILAAYRAGCDYVKLFPAASIGGPAFLEAVRAPCPWVQAIPTGGVEPTVESMRSWYRAGAPAIGMGSKLLPKQLVDARDFDGLRVLVDATVAAIAEARG
ncbi:MAG TPA: bifunctional 4-hydroxy-2-oxoglutarate aldolase/2-dehydro-3-deoxy-phosphogluconate aldolase [Acidimicrobiia bacterium]|nr:bifunctional 4-hydroxy-2-oxoglutarate aldolase/2-dehydro-3-deoxy-phosphogluconate aldolase [Acidimicrobiia bacterium]